MSRHFDELVRRRQKAAPGDDTVGLLQKALKNRMVRPDTRFGWSDCGKYLRVSRIFDLCPRQAVYARHKPVVSIPEVKCNIVGELMMQIGTDLHSYLQNEVLGPMGVLAGEWFCPTCQNRWDGFWKICNCCQREPNVQVVFPVYQEYAVTDEEHCLRGHVDGILELNRLRALAKGTDLTNFEPEFDEFVHLEIKSTNDRTFKEVSASHDVPSYYAAQCSMYQWLLGVKKTLFLYIDRNRIANCSFSYEGDPDLVQLMKDKAKSVISAVVEIGQLPDRVCMSPKDKRAKECPWREECFGLAV